MNFKSLNNDNFMLYAVKHYDNPQCCGMEEFNEDLNRIVYIKRLLKKYKRTGQLRNRLLLNHIITFFNVFGIPSALRMLFFKLDSDLFSALKTYAVYLGYIKEDAEPIEDINIRDIPLDVDIVDCLRKI